MGFKELWPSVPQSSVQEAKYPRCFQTIKYDISDNAYKDFDFLRVQENIYRSRTASNQPPPGKKWKRRGRCVYQWLQYMVHRDWPETVKKMRQTCEAKSVHDLNV
jgi:hypothetical protein